MINWKILLVSCLFTIGCGGKRFTSSDYVDDAGADASTIDADGGDLHITSIGNSTTTTGGSTSVGATVSTSTLQCKCDCTDDRARGIACTPCASKSQCPSNGTGGSSAVSTSTGGANSTGGAGSSASTSSSTATCLSDGIELSPGATQACPCTGTMTGYQTCQQDGTWNACVCSQGTGGSTSFTTFVAGTGGSLGTGGTTSKSTSATGGLNGGTTTITSPTASPIRTIRFEIPGVAQTVASSNCKCDCTQDIANGKSCTQCSSQCSGIALYDGTTNNKISDGACYTGQVFDPANSYSVVPGWYCEAVLDRSKQTVFQIQLGALFAGRYVCSDTNCNNRFASSDFTVYAYDAGSPVAMLGGLLNGWTKQMGLQFTADKSTVHVLLPDTWPAPIN
ncbi:MAG: hypothetical protein WC477_02535 [Patescibacteria group bacterium]